MATIAELEKKIDAMFIIINSIDEKLTKLTATRGGSKSSATTPISKVEVSGKIFNVKDGVSKPNHIPVKKMFNAVLNTKNSALIEAFKLFVMQCMKNDTEAKTYRKKLDLWFAKEDAKGFYDDIKSKVKVLEEIQKYWKGDNNEEVRASSSATTGVKLFTDTLLHKQLIKIMDENDSLGEHQKSNEPPSLEDSVSPNEFTNM